MLALLAFAAMTSHAYPALLIGTYTSPDGSKGIYRTTLDPSTGSLSAPQLAVEAIAPSYVAVHPGGRWVAAVNEFSGGEVRTFRVAGELLEPIGSQSFQGGGPCHVSFSHDGRFLFAAAYGGGSLASFVVGPDGSLSAPVSTHIQSGSGPNPDRQSQPHVHSVFPSPDGKHLVACDLGTDEVLVFAVGERGELTKLGAAKVPAGGGPRHLAFDPEEPYLYVNSEMSCEVTTFRRDPATGLLERLGTVSSLPAGPKEPGWNSAAIRFHPSLRRLVVSNRIHDSLSVFEVGRDGTLRLIQNVPAGVVEPRDFDFDAGGRWLVAAGQKSGEVVSFAVDEQTGKLTATGSRIEVGSAVGVAWMR